MNVAASAWQVEEDDFGGRLVRHRHADVSVIAYVYNLHDRAWAECSMCGAHLGLVFQRPAITEQEELLDPSVP